METAVATTNERTTEVARAEAALPGWQAGRRIVLGALLALLVLGGTLDRAEATKIKFTSNQTQNQWVDGCREAGGTTKRVSSRNVRCTYKDGTKETCNFNTTPAKCTIILRETPGQTGGGIGGGLGDNPVANPNPGGNTGGDAGGGDVVPPTDGIAGGIGDDPVANPNPIGDINSGGNTGNTIIVG